MDVIIIGAGFAGLAAAKKLQEEDYEVIVLEARDRVGGRVYTEEVKSVPVDLGAAWIHRPNGNPVTPLAKAAGLQTYVTDDESVIIYDAEGEVVDDDDLEASEKTYERMLEKASGYAEKQDNDINLLKAIEKTSPGAMQDPLIRYQMSAYTEFDFGGPISNLSSWYYEDDKEFQGADVIIPGGYQEIAEYLAKDLTIYREIVIEGIEYGDDGVSVYSSDGEFEADYVIVTVPLGVLKSGAIEFEPPLPQEKLAAINRVEMGNVNRVVLVFKEAFWPVKTRWFGYLSDQLGKYVQFINTRTFSGLNALITFGFGAYAEEIERKSDNEIKDEILETLPEIFDGVTEPERVIITRWRKDRFARGAYSYNSVGTTRKDSTTLAKPVSNVVYFAGEHTNADYRGTVHGAYLSGLRAAEELLDYDED